MDHISIKHMILTELLYISIQPLFWRVIRLFQSVINILQAGSRGGYSISFFGPTMSVRDDFGVRIVSTLH